MKAILQAQDFKRIIDNTKKFTGGPSKLMSYIYLQVDADKKEVRATALDGHKVSIEYAKLAAVDESFSCYIKPTIPKILKRDTSAELELDGKRLFVTVNDSIMGYVQPEGEYYETNKMINDLTEQPFVGKIGVNAKLLGDALHSTYLSGAKPIVEIEIRGPQDPIIIRAHESGKPTENIKLVLPVRIGQR